MSYEFQVNRTAGRPLGAYIQTQVDYFGTHSQGGEIQPLPDELAQWLGRLRLLYGVPFEYLVPEERLLPKESIRFFYLDRNWIDRLVDGALTIGKLGTRDYQHHEHRQDSLHQSLSLAEVYTRKALRGEEIDPGATVAAGGTVTGLFVRSSLVADYPGLEIRAYDKGTENSNKKKLTLLRMDRLAPDILFCLFHGVPESMEMEEPREGVQFGVEKGNTYRHRDADGVYVSDMDEEDVPMKSSGQVGNRRVVDVKAFAKQVQDTNRRLFPSEDAELLASSSEVALQFLQFPYLQYFAEGGICSGDQDYSVFANYVSFGLFSDEDSPRTISTGFQAALQQSFQLILGNPVDLTPIFT